MTTDAVIVFAGIFAVTFGVLLSCMALASILRNAPVQCQDCLWAGRTDAGYRKHHRRCHEGTRGTRLPQWERETLAIPGSRKSDTIPLRRGARPAEPLPRRYT